MNNPIYQALNGNNIISQFEQFRRSFSGNPQEEVQRLLDSGRMTQEQFNSLSQQATQLQRLLGGR